jgi:ribosomal protein L37AE/L43A
MKKILNELNFIFWLETHPDWYVYSECPKCKGEGWVIADIFHYFWECPQCKTEVEIVGVARKPERKYLKKVGSIKK